MKNICKKIKQCRISKDRNLVDVAKIGPLTLTGTFLKKKNEKIPKTPVDLVFSKKSYLLQLKHNYNQSLLFGKNYGYRSGLNHSMRLHLLKKSKSLEKKVNFKKGDRVLDIGSNDGTFLNCFSKKVLKFGVDPTAKKFRKYYKKDIKIKDSLFKNNLFNKKIKFKLITSIAMFYDLSDPRKFCKTAGEYLDPEGIFHIEIAYLPDILRKFSFDTFCQEHLTYYSFLSFKYLIDQTPFKIIDFSRNSINGGSINFNLAFKNSKWSPKQKKIDQILLNEKKIKIHHPQTYKNYFKKIKVNSNKIHNLLTKLKNKNKKIFAMGASTKGNVILQMCNADSKIITAIYDVNPFKFGRFTPGTKILIKDEREIYKDKPDYIFLLIWHFKKTLKIKFKKLKSYNFKYIWPFPELKISKPSSNAK